MLNHRALAAAVVATGAGAVIFLSTGQTPASTTPSAPFVPVPVVLPPTATELPSANPAVPAAEHVAPPVVPSAAPTTSSTPAPAVVPSKRVVPTPAPVRTAAPLPKRFSAQSTPVQQPQSAGTEPNGTGGWQLSACYDESCVAKSAPADPNQGTGTQTLNAGPLGQLGIVNDIADLIGWH